MWLIKRAQHYLGCRQTNKLRLTLEMTFSSVAQSCPTLYDPMNRSTPGLPVHHQLLEFTQTHVHQVSDAIQPSHPLLSPSPPAPSPSQHQSFPMSQLFAWGGQSIGVSASASFLPKNTQDWSPLEWTGWISLQISLQIQGTLKSLLQHHSSKASILRCSVFFTVQLSHPYVTNGKTIALTRWTFVGKVMSSTMYKWLYFWICKNEIIFLKVNMKGKLFQFLQVLGIILGFLISHWFSVSLRCS